MIPAIADPSVLPPVRLANSKLNPTMPSTIPAICRREIVSSRNRQPKSNSAIGTVALPTIAATPVDTRAAPQNTAAKLIVEVRIPTEATRPSDEHRRHFDDGDSYGEPSPAPEQAQRKKCKTMIDHARSPIGNRYVRLRDLRAWLKAERSLDSMRLPGR